MLPLHQQNNFYNNMADVNKQKLQLRSGLSINGDSTPSPATKLLINHGKPNFTIPRSYNKTQNGNASPTSPPPTMTGRYFQNNSTNNNNNNNNEFMVKSTIFNGVFKPSNLSAATKQSLPQNGNATIAQNANDNEAAKVVLRRPKVVKTELKEPQDNNNVPEFILRQRRIQERLANQNILDFENRRSGYFTQVLISPSSPNRQSFVETMSSPAVKPGLEMSPLATTQENPEPEANSNEQKDEQVEQETRQQVELELENVIETVSLEPVTLNGQIEEEEVAKAIEEVNKAVEGEDDDRNELEDQLETKENDTSAAIVPEVKVEETLPKKEEQAALENLSTEKTVELNSSNALELTEKQTSHESGQDETTNDSAVPIIEETRLDYKTNGHDVEHQENNLLQSKNLDNGITISHVNGVNGPSIPAPDPSGEKGVNFEIKTVVSFSQELGNGDNKYPDTIKVVTDGEVLATDGDLKELTKLKFDIKADNEDIEVKPVLVDETI